MIPAEKTPAPARVLLVDDDQIFRSEFTDLLGEYGVREAASGQEALDILRRPHTIDVVILDVRMSGMNGIEVLEGIKAIAPNVRVVMLTGYGSKDIVVEALRNRADDFIEKPLDVEAVRQALERHLDIQGKLRFGAGLYGKVERVKDFIQRNADKKVTLREAASAVCVSPKYLSRIFKEQSRMGFNDFKLAVKMNYAQTLLKEPAYTVEQISEKLGYQNPESFIRQFKKIMKLTPAHFRRAAGTKKGRPGRQKKRPGRLPSKI